MYVEILSESRPVAKIQHDCEACTWLLQSGICGMGYTRPELRVISKARKNNWKIVPGQKYTRQNNKQCGEIYTFKAITEVHDICIKYDLYDC